jgi:hypothetical protein
MSRHLCPAMGTSISCHSIAAWASPVRADQGHGEPRSACLESCVAKARRSLPCLSCTLHNRSSSANMCLRHLHLHDMPCFRCRSKKTEAVGQRDSRLASSHRDRSRTRRLCIILSRKPRPSLWQTHDTRTKAVRLAGPHAVQQQS